AEERGRKGMALVPAQPGRGGPSAGRCSGRRPGVAGVTWQWRVALAAQRAQEEEARIANAERRAKEEEAVRAGPPHRPAAEAATQAGAAQRLAVEERRKAETHLTYSRVAQALSLWERNDVARARQLLEACPEEHRGWEWHYLEGLCRSHLATAETRNWAW